MTERFPPYTPLKYHLVKCNEDPNRFDSDSNGLVLQDSPDFPLTHTHTHAVSFPSYLYTPSLKGPHFSSENTPGSIRGRAWVFAEACEIKTHPRPSVHSLAAGFQRQGNTVRGLCSHEDHCGNIPQNTDVAGAEPE